ncbi:MAG: hypothetical protein KF878_20640 [Planctomycetes bacterium]|nr:hypothetical protein [Planctomycetota bacterium]
MTPLTVDCARVRQLLPDLLEPPGAAGPPAVAPPTVAPPTIAPDDRAFAEDHLRGCPGCAEAREQIAEALRALEHLSPADVARLRALADAEPDARPLARLAAACVGLVVLAVLGAVIRLAPGPGAAPAAPAAPAPAAWSPATFGALAVGAEVGIEVEPDLLPPPIELPAPTPPEPAPEPIVVAEALCRRRPSPPRRPPGRRRALVAAAPIGAPAPADPALGRAAPDPLPRRRRPRSPPSSAGCSSPTARATAA